MAAPRWKPADRERLLEVLATAPSWSQAARTLGCDRIALKRYCEDHNLLAFMGSELPKEPESGDAEFEAQALEYLRDRGYMLSRDVRQENRQFERVVKNFRGCDFRIGVVTDTHLCSKYQQLTHLHTAYDYFADEGIDTVLHCGDLCAGNGRMYRGQEYEIHVHGYDQQRRYIIDEYPHREGVQTLIIAGNHDASWVKSSGANIVKAVCDKRPDMSYLGQSGAFLELHGIRFYIMHPTGGVSYARSYKLQKLIEQMSPQNKPQVFLSGHFHVTCTLKSYRNVYGMLLPCFEAQTPYLLEKGLYPEVGFTVLRVTVGDTRPGDLVRVVDESLPFFEPNAEDY
jgi:predicted phosphodiesterase